MHKSKVIIILFLLIIVINVISILNQLLFKDEIFAYGEKKEKIRYKEGDYKVYTDYLVQNPLKYGKIEPDIQNDNFEYQNDYGEQLDQHTSLYLNSKCATCKDMPSTGNIDLDSLISVIEENVENEVSIQLIQLFNQIEYDLNTEAVFDIFVMFYVHILKHHFCQLHLD
jgi:hypothetical protein